MRSNPIYRTFLSQKTRRNYVEDHHLIPFSLLENFKHRLDILGNIILLYPNCHCRLHHARLKNKEDALSILYNKRKQVLVWLGIEISLSNLMRWYR